MLSSDFGSDLNYSELSNNFAFKFPGKISSFTNALMIQVLLSYSSNAFLITLLCTLKIYFHCIFFFAFLILCASLLVISFVILTLLVL